MRKVSPVTGKPDYPGREDGWIITSQYVGEEYFRLFGEWHTGNDISKDNALGSPIYAAADGTVKVVTTERTRGFGVMVFIEHKPGELYTRYGHMDSTLVVRGQQVSAGTQIGVLGATGNVTGPHLHFDIMRRNNSQDWPGLDRDRILREYINPTEWFSEENTDGATITVTSDQSEWRMVTATAQLNVRARPNRSAAINYRLPFHAIVQLKPVRFLSDSFTWRELVSGGWIAEEYTVPTEVVGETPESAPIIILPTPAPAAVVSVSPRGLHGNAGGWQPSQEELNIVRDSGIDTVLIVAYEPNQAGAIGLFQSVGVKKFVFRAAHHGAPSGNAQEYIQRTLPTLKQYYDALNGGKMALVVHNEPNITQEGFRSAWNNGAEFSQWFLQVATAYRAALPGVQIGFPAMSPGGSVVIGNFERQDEWQFTDQCAEAIRASDWVAVHAYFVGDGKDIDLKAFRWRTMARNKQVIITEGGPADNIETSAEKMRNMFTICANAGFPVMAWVLAGAGAWGNADWVRHQIKP